MQWATGLESRSISSLLFQETIKRIGNSLFSEVKVEVRTKNILQQSK